MSIGVVSGNPEEMEISIKIEDCYYRRKKIESILYTYSKDSKLNDQRIQLLVNNILYLRGKAMIISLEDYKYLIGRLSFLRNQKKTYLKRICDLSEDVKVIDKEIDKLNREKEQVSRKIVELNKNGKKR